MKAFDPESIGLTSFVIPALMTDGYRWRGESEDGEPREVKLYNCVDTWEVVKDDGHTFYIPASFDHAHVVALLRANGAMIEGGDDE
jgi:hypothetical protein